MIHYNIRRNISFSIKAPNGRAKSEKITIQPPKILEISKDKMYFKVYSPFNKDTYFKVSHQGRTVFFRKEFLLKIKELELKGDITKEK